ncbi:MAG: lysoplasmalogenase [Bacteroidales bacterium]|nr:lysoplasmalogenase [Bacteroidales bacterium]
MNAVENPRLGLLLVAVLYTVLCMVYFLPADLPHKIALPLLFLSVVSVWMLPWQMRLAMAFSCLGDLLGSMHSFPGQMGAFTIAHVSMMIYFGGRFRDFCNRDRRNNDDTIDGYGVCCRNSVMKVLVDHYNIIVLLAVVCLGTFSFMTIVPAAPEGFLRYGVAGYCVVISLMFLAAMLQRCALFAAGASLFVFSDMVLGWNRFVSPVECSGYLVMVPYYLGQLLLFAGAFRSMLASDN